MTRTQSQAGRDSRRLPFELGCVSDFFGGLAVKLLLSHRYRGFHPQPPRHSGTLPQMSSKALSHEVAFYKPLALEPYDLQGSGCPRVLGTLQPYHLDSHSRPDAIQSTAPYTTAAARSRQSGAKTGKLLSRTSPTADAHKEPGQQSTGRGAHVDRRPGAPGPAAIIPREAHSRRSTGPASRAGRVEHDGLRLARGGRSRAPRRGRPRALAVAQAFETGAQAARGAAQAAPL